MKHYVALLAILAVVTAAHVGIRSAQAKLGAEPRSVSLDGIPERIGRYVKVGHDYDVDDHTKRVLGTSAILLRDYSAPSGRRIGLTIVYAGATRRSLHFPEVCLVGAGWEIREQERRQVGILFDAKQLVLVNAERKQAVLYWFKTGDKLTGNFFVNAYYWASNQLTLSTPTSAMIKLTTVLGPGESEDAAFAMLDDFAAKLVPLLKEHVP